MPKSLYKNRYSLDHKYGVIRIFGGKHTEEFTFSKSDFKLLSSVNWGLMEIGRVGYKTLVPYTVISRKSVHMGRWLLDVTAKDQKVEHKDRNHLNFQRTNLYVVNKNEMKSKISLNGLPLGITISRQRNGNVTGYKVSYKQDGTTKVKCFGIRAYGHLSNALDAASSFRKEIWNLQTNFRGLGGGQYDLPRV